MIQFEDIITGAESAITSNVAATDSIVPIEQKLMMFDGMSFDEIINRMVKSMLEFGSHLAIALIVFYIGRFAIRKILRLVASIFIHRRLDQSLAVFVLSLAKIVMYFILVITVIGILGIETSSFLALFASAGVAIGMALSGTLQNFAGGVLILILKPYKIGDYIEAQGYAGTVKAIQIFSTIINTTDNKQIIIPNGGLSTSSINNYSKEQYRRVDWTVSIAYGDDFDVAKKAITEILLSDPRVIKQYTDDDTTDTDNNAETETEQARLDEAAMSHGWFHSLRKKKTQVAENIKSPLNNFHKDAMMLLPKVDRKPFVGLGTLNSSSIDITVRAWTRSEDYWGIFFTMNERFYKELPKYGLNFPFPQLDVHVNQANTPV
jgi:small conductance mechanosensitive channel